MLIALMLRALRAFDDVVDGATQKTLCELLISALLADAAAAGLLPPLYFISPLRRLPLPLCPPLRRRH